MGTEEMRREWLQGPHDEYKRIVAELKKAKRAIACPDLSGEVIALLRNSGYIVKMDHDQVNNGSNYKVSLQ